VHVREDFVMVAPLDPASRIAALERALQRQQAVSRDLERLVEDRTRDLFLAMERIKVQGRLVGARTAIALLGQHGTLEDAAPHMLKTFGEQLGWQLVQLWTIDRDAQVLRRSARWGEPATIDVLAAHAETTSALDAGLPGRVWSTGAPAWVVDASLDASSPRSSLRAGCAFPIVVDGAVHAVIEMFAEEAREPDDDLLNTFGALGGQIGQFIENARSKDQLRAKELQIARHIQTAILPRDLSVPGLDVAAVMRPAIEVAGDYYDVMPFADGAWFGIGDVTGHGVGAGMIMIMVQSAVSALVRRNVAQEPRDVLVALNDMLFDNIRRRLCDDDHVTFSILRYTRDGSIRFAGAHEDFVLWRAASRACELVPTPGTWLGAKRAIDDVTIQSTLQLERGDVLLLYTDGITEARDADRHCFGIERLCDEVARLAGEEHAMTDLCARLVSRVASWSVAQDDDVSMVAMRYIG
jgi:serine phosphatase RsbU (regulator of sigma subunit)